MNVLLGRIRPMMGLLMLILGGIAYYTLNVYAATGSDAALAIGSACIGALGPLGPKLIDSEEKS